MAEITGVFTCRLKPGANADAFEQFMRTELLPAYRNLSGCLTANLLHASKGSTPDEYISISLWESIEANDAVFGPDGQLPPAYVAAQDKLYEFVADAKWVGYSPC